MANVTEAVEHTAREIAQAMDRCEASINGLAAETGIAYSTLRRKLKHPSERNDFTMGEVLLIAEALGVSPAAFTHPAFGAVA